MRFYDAMITTLSSLIILSSCRSIKYGGLMEVPVHGTGYKLLTPSETYPGPVGALEEVLSINSNKNVKVWFDSDKKTIIVDGVSKSTLLTILDEIDRYPEGNRDRYLTNEEIALANIKATSGVDLDP